MKKVHDIPTTIVTGFLGVGKSTAINSLLSEKPEGERWGVLINEFGKIGVDATLIGHHKGVSIREIAGGCLCCTAGQAFEVALNRLIRDTYPDRILIEPTGIGHPLKIIRTLTGGYFCDILDLRATICLVDARKLTEAKYREHPVFQDQLNLADVLVGNKADCYSDDDCSRFMELVAGSIPPKAASSMISFGKLDPQLLKLPRNPLRMAGFPDAHPAKEIAFIASRLSETTHEEAKPASIESWTMREGSGEGYWSGSWLIGTDYSFDKIALSEVINSFPFSRVKGIMQCNEGWLKINGSDGNVELSMSEPCESSRLEIIDTLPLQIKKIEKKLREINS